jgi:CHAD domain-containing protein
VELALDEGEVRAGGQGAAIREAEIELLEGEVAAVFDLARRLFPTGPVRFGTANKAARGYELARTGRVAGGWAPRFARSLPVDPDATVEQVARDFFRDCLAQVAGNMVVVAESEAPEGPHQLRVGLRRLRTGFAVFEASLGAAAMAPLADEARRLGQVVGALRDADVLIEDVGREVAAGLDAPAAEALAGALAAQREATRATVRAELAGGRATGFLFDLAAFIEGRGWLAPSDYSQSERLAEPIGAAAPGFLDRRWRTVTRRGRRIRRLDDEALHALRKALKKLRYSVDMLGPLFRDSRVEPFLKALKTLQDGFGSLNDAAMAGAVLTAPDAPGARDPAAQRAAGWVLGRLAVRAAEDRPILFERWDKLADSEPFWR